MADENAMKIKEIINARFQNPKFVYDGKRIQPIYERKTYDYSSALIYQTQVPLLPVFNNPRFNLGSQILNMPSPDESIPLEAVTNKFVHMSINKIRSPVNSVVWNPDGRRLLSGSCSGEITMWNGFSFNFDTIVQAHESPIRALLCMSSKEKIVSEHFDYIVLGTGLTETAISCILSKNANIKILHIDKNNTYGSEFSTMQYGQLEKYFNKDASPLDSLIKYDKEFNIDLTPKILLQDSRLKDFLLENKIEELVVFQTIKESYIYTGSLHSIPTSEAEALRSSAISFTEKYKVMKFFWNVRSYFKNNNIKMKESMLEEFKSFGLKKETMDYIGHAIALNLDDEYLNKTPNITYDRIVKYISSMASYENTKSPYIYPVYGLSELCQSFARKSAINGTVFMLNANIKEINKNELEVIDPNGERHRFVTKKIIADPRYFDDSIISKEIIRCIMIMKKGTLASRNIIYLKSHLNRKNDIFCVILGNEESACPKGYEIGIISTLKETDDPLAEIEGILKQYSVIKYFWEIRNVYYNKDKEDVIFSKNVDESAIMDNLYEDITEILNKLKMDISENPIKE